MLNLAEILNYQWPPLLGLRVIHVLLIALVFYGAKGIKR